MKITQLIWGETINAYIIEVEINTSQSYTFINYEVSPCLLYPNPSSPQSPKVVLFLNDDHTSKEEALYAKWETFTCFLSLDLMKAIWIH